MKKPRNYGPPPFPANMVPPSKPIVEYIISDAFMRVVTSKAVNLRDFWGEISHSDVAKAVYSARRVVEFLKKNPDTQI